MKIKLYIEGGGNKNSILKSELRKGFSKFFEKAGLQGKTPKSIACGSRNEAFDRFCTAVNNPTPDEIPILLVDSEDPVTANTPWAHLRNRDNWQQPPGTNNDQAHLMVQCMESWFLADQNALAQYFGQGFRANALPTNPNIENIPKHDLFHALKAATRQTRKCQYNKGKHSFKILERLDPTKVRQASDHADRLLKYLRDTLA